MNRYKVVVDGVQVSVWLRADEAARLIGLMRRRAVTISDLEKIGRVEQ